MHASGDEIASSSLVVVSFPQRSYVAHSAIPSTLFPCTVALAVCGVDAAAILVAVAENTHGRKTKNWSSKCDDYTTTLSHRDHTSSSWSGHVDVFQLGRHSKSSGNVQKASYQMLLRSIAPSSASFCRKRVKEHTPPLCRSGHRGVRSDVRRVVSL